MLRALNFRRFEANLLLRRADMMPLYAVGDLAGLLGLLLESLQEDLAAVLPNMADGEAARNLWKTYQHWDGTAPLHRELQRTDGEWLTVDFRRLQDEDVDLVPSTAPPTCTAVWNSTSTACRMPRTPASPRQPSCPA